MLKTLEEPPPTSNSSWPPPTRKSAGHRAVALFAILAAQYDPAAGGGASARMLDTEQVGYGPAALTLLGRAASGSMRDALSLLDQAIAYGIGEVRRRRARHAGAQWIAVICSPCWRRWPTATAQR